MTIFCSTNCNRATVADPSQSTFSYLSIIRPPYFDRSTACVDMLLSLLFNWNLIAWRIDLLIDITVFWRRILCSIILLILPFSIERSSFASTEGLHILRKKWLPCIDYQGCLLPTEYYTYSIVIGNAVTYWLQISSPFRTCRYTYCHWQSGRPAV